MASFAPWGRYWYAAWTMEPSDLGHPAHDPALTYLYSMAFGRLFVRVGRFRELVLAQTFTNDVHSRFGADA
eukprot:3806351-Prymnesium_polylepis.2